MRCSESERTRLLARDDEEERSISFSFSFFFFLCRFLYGSPAVFLCVLLCAEGEAGNSLPPPQKKIDRGSRTAKK